MKSTLMLKIEELQKEADIYENEESTEGRKNLASDNIKNICSKIFNMTYSK